MAAKIIKVNMELFKNVFNNNDGNCLCKLNTKCPCINFLENKECKCGVFYK